MKKLFKRITLFSTTLLASLPAYVLSGWGIAGLTIGAAAAVAATAALVHKHNKDTKKCYKNCPACQAARHKKSCDQTMYASDTTQSKKEMKKDRHQYKKNLQHEKRALHKAKRKGVNCAEAQQHRSEIQKLEAMIDNLDQRIKSL